MHEPGRANHVDTPVRVYLGLGSNISPEENLRLGIRELRWRYGALERSPVYRSRAVGFAGDDFLNMVVGLETTAGLDAVREQIDLIHDLAGRDRGSGRFQSRPLDVDLLLYGDSVVRRPKLTLPRPDILEYAFVLRPLAELAPDLVHPETGRTLRSHWDAFNQASAALTPVHVDF